jgi:DNA-directed RNA polymerase specialized sigma24 family protein
LWLRYAEDMSVNDIAAVLERSVSWTKVNLLRARQQLDVELGGAVNANASKSYG